MVFKILPIILCTLLLVSCESKVNESLYKREISQDSISEINNKWAKSTIDLIKLGKVEKGKYVNYSASINHETSLDETWKGVNVLQRLNTKYNKLNILKYVKQYKPENEIDKLKINAILKTAEQPILYESNNDIQIKTLIKRGNLSEEEKLDEIFTYHLYIGRESLQLSETTVNLLKEFLKSLNLPKDINHGYYYDLAYLCNEYGIDNATIKKDYWKEELIQQSRKEKLDLVELYYICNINILLGNSIGSDLINKLVDLESEDGSYNKAAHQKEGTVFASYLVVDILDKSGYLDLIKKDKLSNYLLRQQDVNTGGFIVRRVVKSDLISGILAETSLEILGDKSRSLSSTEIMNLLINQDENNWKVKYFGLRLVREELTNDQKLVIKNNLKKYWEEISQLKRDELVSDIRVLEGIVYSLYINKELEGRTSKNIQLTFNEVSNYILKNYQDKSPIEISLALEIKKILEMDIKNKNNIIKFLSSFYDNRQKQFIFKEHNEMIMNYFIIKSLMILDYDFRGMDPKKIIFEFADLEKGGFNSLRNQFETSSLITTFYGTVLLQEVINYQN